MGIPELDPFQHDTLAFLDHAEGRAVIADPMGARKTGTTLAWLGENAVDVLVVAPAAVHGHWAREAARFAPHFTVDHGRGTKQKRQLALAGQSYNRLYITTYESMKQDQHAIVQHGFDTVVFDEAHRLKGRRTQVALSANAVVKQRKHVLLLTGTPVLNHASELWQYLHMLIPSRYPAFWRWAETHFDIEVTYFRNNQFPTRIIHDFRPGHEDIVRNQIEPFFIQRNIEELFPLQAWVEEPEHVEISVDLSPKERKLYDNLVKHKWGILPGRDITTTTGLDLTTRLTQITSDWGTLSDDVEHGTKVDTAVELVKDLLERDEPVLVFAKYKTTVQRIVAALPGAMAYTGDHPSEVRDEVARKFVMGDIKVLVGTLDSLSEGVDGLQNKCSTVVMVDRHWTPAKNDQAIGRVRRSGQVRKVTVYHIFANDTIDATITAACLRKTNVIELLKGMALSDAIYGRV